MKAVVVTEPGDPSVLRVVERPVPTIDNAQVLIKVKAAGLNRPDIYQRKGNYPPPEGAPQDIPGLEVSGIIEACGIDANQWHVGQEICALVWGGGYAEYVAVEANHCLPIPTGLNMMEGAVLPETIFTVWHNVFQRGGLQSGESLLVHGGASGIGVTAIQLAKAFGAKVYATAGSIEKCILIENLGGERAINYRTEDFETILKCIGMDVILDMVGGGYIEKNLRILKPDGRLVYINTMQGRKSEIDFGMVMAKRLTLTGSTLRNRNKEFKAKLAAEVFQNVWPVIEKGGFKPIVDRVFDLSEASNAHRYMESGKHIGKIVLKVF